MVYKNRLCQKRINSFSNQMRYRQLPITVGFDTIITDRSPSETVCRTLEKAGLSKDDAVELVASIKLISDIKAARPIGVGTDEGFSDQDAFVQL